MEATDKQIEYLRRLTRKIEELRESYPFTLAGLPSYVNWSAVMYINSSDASYMINKYKEAIKAAKQLIK